MRWRRGPLSLALLAAVMVSSACLLMQAHYQLAWHELDVRGSWRRPSRRSARLSPLVMPLHVFPHILHQVPAATPLRPVQTDACQHCDADTCACTQTWRDRQIPRAFKSNVDTWRSLQPEWEYRFHTDADNLALVTSASSSKRTNPRGRPSRSASWRRPAALDSLLNRWHHWMALCVSPLEQMAPLDGTQRLNFASQLCWSFASSTHRNATVWRTKRFLSAVR